MAYSTRTYAGHTYAGSDPEVPVSYQRRSTFSANRVFFRVRRVTSQVVPRQVNPPIPIIVVHSVRVRGLPVRRGRNWVPPPRQFNPPIVTTPARRRTQLLPRAALSHRTLIPPQDNAPPILKQRLALRGWQRGKVRRSEVVPPQFNPPFPFAEIKQTRAQRGWRLVRGRMWWPPQNQAPAPNPPIVISPSQRRQQRIYTTRQRKQWAAPIDQPTLAPPSRRIQRLVVLRRGKNWVPTPPQFNPPMVFIPTQRRTQRGWLFKRGKTFAPGIPQANPYPVTRPRVHRIWRPIRGRYILPPIDQQRVPVETFRRVQRTSIIRGRRGQPTPPQSTPLPPSLRRVQRTWRAIRGQTRFPVQPQAAPTPPTFVFTRQQRRAQRGWLLRRGKQWTPVPPQVTFVNPAFVSTRPHRRTFRGWLFRRGRAWEAPRPPAGPANLYIEPTWGDVLPNRQSAYLLPPNYISAFLLTNGREWGSLMTGGNTTGSLRPSLTSGSLLTSGQTSTIMLSNGRDKGNLGS